MKRKAVYLFLCLFLSGFMLYAQGNVLVGDVNDNGTVDIVDALEVALYYVNNNHILDNPGAADVNCDTSIDIIDALLIARYYVGLIDTLSGCAPDNYPTTYFRLSTSEIILLQQEFERINVPDFFGTVGPYGFLDSHYVPFEQIPPAIAMTDEGEILQAARGALIRNIKFTNVSTTTPLDDYRIIPRSSYWTVEYSFNTYNGLPTKEITIIVEGNQDAFCIERHYYPANIVIPTDVKISPAQAMERAVGQVIIFYNVSGDPVEYTVIEEALTEEPSEKWVIPYETDTTLEYRYCWNVLISEGMWNMFIDVITGEVIYIKQNFQT